MRLKTDSKLTDRECMACESIGTYDEEMPCASLPKHTDQQVPITEQPQLRPTHVPALRADSMSAAALGPWPCPMLMTLILAP